MFVSAFEITLGIILGSFAAGLVCFVVLLALALVIGALPRRKAWHNVVKFHRREPDDAA